MVNNEVRHYGVWRATPTHYIPERSENDSISPHIHLFFEDGSNNDSLHAAINVKSTSTRERGLEAHDEDSWLVYWINNNLDHAYLRGLLDLDLGFHRLRGQSGLDYLRREDMFDFQTGMVLPHDQPGKNNDILDELEPILDKGIAHNARIYLFGSQFDDRRGIHNVHMNQGSLPNYQNNVYRDGGFFLYFEEDDHWEGVFLAFASQRVPTNDRTGEPEPGAQKLAEKLPLRA
jgi:uncharacterized protein YukJ